MLADVQVGQAIPHKYKYKYKYKHTYKYKYNHHLCWQTSRWVKQYLTTTNTNINTSTNTITNTIITCAGTRPNGSSNTSHHHHPHPTVVKLKQYITPSSLKLTSRALHVNMVSRNRLVKFGKKSRKSKGYFSLIKCESKTVSKS